CSARSTCARCWAPAHAGTNAAPIPNDDDEGRYFTQYRPYRDPDAYGAKPPWTPPPEAEPLGGVRGDAPAFLPSCDSRAPWTSRRLLRRTIRRTIGPWPIFNPISAPRWPGSCW